jgi:adenylosuccinate lyase
MAGTLLSPLTAISPLDGRYREQIAPLAKYFSEFGWMKYRVLVEIEYFIALCELNLPQLSDFDKSQYDDMRQLYEEFSQADAFLIKNFEQKTKHDIKAVEYYLKQEWEALGLQKYKEFIHFGLTSQDVNNTAIPLLLKNAMDKVYVPQIKNVVRKLEHKAKEWFDIPMLAHTHGQPASPTRLGKEIRVFTERIKGQLNLLASLPFHAKFGGATGNFNAHYAAYPQIDWLHFAEKFVDETLGLKRLSFTTQIDPYDGLAAILDNLKRINTIFIDFARDMWQYISMEYFKQNIIKGEVGSSAMPHKVNPIDFENAEGNFAISNALLEFMSAKLPISRLQRDLTDSTVLRNLGVVIGHSFLALLSLDKGIDKISLNQQALQNDLEENWVVVAEAIQTILRRENYPNPYEALKDLTRINEKINKENLHHFIDTLQIDEDVKTELKQITPFNYIGKNNPF